MMNKQCLSLPDREYFVRLISFFFGVWLAYAGIMKWVGGSAGFVEMINTQFAGTWSPAALNTGLAWLILIAEPILGLLLVTGIKPREIWSLTALLMFMLTFGMTMLGNHEVVSSNWQYLILACACAAISKPCGTCCKEGS